MKIFIASVLLLVHALGATTLQAQDRSRQEKPHTPIIEIFSKVCYPAQIQSAETRLLLDPKIATPTRVAEALQSIRRACDAAGMAAQERNGLGGTDFIWVPEWAQEVLIRTTVAHENGKREMFARIFFGSVPIAQQLADCGSVDTKNPQHRHRCRVAQMIARASDFVRNAEDHTSCRFTLPGGHCLLSLDLDLVDPETGRPTPQAMNLLEKGLRKLVGEIRGSADRGDLYRDCIPNVFNLDFWNSSMARCQDVQDRPSWVQKLSGRDGRNKMNAKKIGETVVHSITQTNIAKEMRDAVKLAREYRNVAMDGFHVFRDSIRNDLGVDVLHVRHSIRTAPYRKFLQPGEVWEMISYHMTQDQFATSFPLDRRVQDPVRHKKRRHANVHETVNTLVSNMDSHEREIEYTLKMLDGLSDQIVQARDTTRWALHGDVLLLEAQRSTQSHLLDIEIANLEAGLLAGAISDESMSMAINNPARLAMREVCAMPDAPKIVCE